MAEYIKREATIKAIVDSRNRYYNSASNQYLVGRCDGLDIAAGLLRVAPAADVAPVVHGRWEWFDEETGTPSTGYEREWGWRCSHCKEELPDDYDDPDDRPAFRFCYNCGAKMDGGDNDAKSV